MKLDLILENVRNRYNLGLLEESEGLDEKTLLQGKILINESTMAIRSMLVEEGTIVSVQNILEEAWTDAVIDAANSAYDDGAEAIDSVAGGVQGAAHGIAGVGGLAVGDAADGKMDYNYKEAPGAIAKLANQGYEQGYQQGPPSVIDTATTARAVGDFADNRAALAGAGAAAGLAGAGLAVGADSPKVAAAGRQAGQFAQGAKYGAQNPNQVQMGGFNKAKQAGARFAQPVSKLAGQIRTRFAR